MRLWHDQALIKESYGNPTSWHFDVGYWGFDSTNAISCWVALDDATYVNGCLHFINKSHHFLRNNYNSNLFKEINIQSNMATIFQEFPVLSFFFF